MVILVESEGPVPGVQMYSYNGALTKLRGKLHFVTFVLQITCIDNNRIFLLKQFICLPTEVKELFQF